MIINIKPPPLPPDIEDRALQRYTQRLNDWCTELAANLNRMLSHIDDSNITALSFGRLTDVSISDEDIVSLSYSKLTDIPEAEDAG